MRITDSGRRFCPLGEAEVDQETKKNLWELAQDILKHSFGNLIKTLFSEINKQNDYVEANDVYIYIKLTAFFMSLFRHFSYEKLGEEKKISSSASLNLDLNQIGPSLQVQNIDYIFQKSFMQTMETSAKSRNLFEFIAGIEYLHELLFLVRDMASINNERMKQNAKILERKIFSLDIFKLIHFGFDSFDPNLHPEYHMHALLRFSDIAILSIEKYSKGQSLTINTHKKKRALKKKKEFGGFEEEDGMIGDVMDLVSDEESDWEEVIVTK